MRPIKFRAWKHTEYPEMINHISFIDWINGIVGFPYQLSRDTFREDEENINNMMLMQCTGLKDKNGVEIYEGDVVKWGHLNQWSREQPHRIAEVKFNPDIQFHSQVGVFNFGSFAYRDTTETDLEVIGNVYENPELLEEKNEALL